MWYTLKIKKPPEVIKMKKGSLHQTKSSGSFTSFIKQHPLVMFFTLAVSYMWIVDILMVGLLKLEGYTFTLISSFGPVLSAMYLMTVIDPGRVEYSPKSQRIAFITCLIVAGALRWISRIWWEYDLSWRVLPGDAILVLLTAFVASSAFSCRKGIRTLMHPIINWKVNWKWYAFAVFFWPALTLAGNLLAVLLSIPVPEGPKLPDAPLFLVIPVSFAWAFFFNGTMGEEGGWRGFALPRLQNRFSPLIASIILGFFWGAFHWSGFFLGYRGNLWSLWIRLGDIALAIVFTWLYN